jgi:hypothetical protein
VLSEPVSANWLGISISDDSSALSQMNPRLTWRETDGPPGVLRSIYAASLRYRYSRGGLPAGQRNSLTSSLTGACQGRLRAPVPLEADAYFRGEKFAGTRILLYWLTIIACALGRNA